VRFRENRVALSGAHEAAGKRPAKVDEKGRLKIPAVFLDELKEYGNQFYITSTTGETARITQMKVGRRSRQTGVRREATNRAKRKFLMRTSYYGQTAGVGWAGKTVVADRVARSGANQGRCGRPWESGLPGSDDHARALDQLKRRAVHGRRRQGLEDLGI